MSDTTYYTNRNYGKLITVFFSLHKFYIIFTVGLENELARVNLERSVYATQSLQIPNNHWI